MREKLHYQELSGQFYFKHKNEIAEILADALGQPEKTHRVLNAYQDSIEAKLWGCFCQQKLIAVAGFYPLSLSGSEQAGAKDLKHFALHPQFRKQGLGKASLLGLISHLELYRLDLQCDDDAVGFYRKSGFATRLESIFQEQTKRYGAYYLNAEFVLQESFRFPHVPVENVLLPDIQKQLQVLRLDLLHPLLSGNKWFKLWHSLLKAQKSGKQKLLSFGGVYSNHLYALAAAGKLLGFETRGIIRGERPEEWNPNLKFCRAMGMHLQFVSRQEYRALREAEAYEAFCLNYPEYLCIPEGGGHEEGLRGAEMIQEYIPWSQPHTLAIACGTGATLAGLIRRRPVYQNLLGVSVLKGDFHRQSIRDWLAIKAEQHEQGWEIETAFHCGGYAKKNEALLAFIQSFEKYNDLPIEPVYTAKLLYALQEKLKRSEINTSLLAVHSGGVSPQI